MATEFLLEPRPRACSLGGDELLDGGAMLE